MSNDSPTVQYRSSLVRVVIVHESPRPCFAVADALRARHVVRMAHTLDELREQIGLVDRLACVLCVPGARLRAREVRDEVVRCGVSQERMVFVTPDELASTGAVLQRVGAVIAAFGSRPRLAS